MGMKCGVCTHPRTHDIDSDILSQNGTQKDIAARYGLGQMIVSRHIRQGHIADGLARAAKIESLQAVAAEPRAYQTKVADPVRRGAETILERMASLDTAALKQLHTWEEQEGETITRPQTVEQWQAASNLTLRAVEQLRRNAELRAKILGELSTVHQHVHVHQSDEWRQFRAAIMQELARFPEARRAVVGRLRKELGAAGASADSVEQAGDDTAPSVAPPLGLGDRGRAPAGADREAGRKACSDFVSPPSAEGVSASGSESESGSGSCSGSGSSGAIAGVNGSHIDVQPGGPSRGKDQREETFAIEIGSHPPTSAATPKGPSS